MNRKRILVVDDDESILSVVGIILEDEGYDVALLQDGTKLFERIDEFHPDLIVMDVMLGNADGRQLCNTIKADNQLNAIPVVMISAGFEMSKTIRDACNPDDFIEKPFDIDDLVARVDKLMA